MANRTPIGGKRPTIDHESSGFTPLSSERRIENEEASPPPSATNNGFKAVLLSPIRLFGEEEDEEPLGPTRNYEREEDTLSIVLPSKDTSVATTTSGDGEPSVCFAQCDDQYGDQLSQSYANIAISESREAVVDASSDDEDNNTTSVAEQMAQLPPKVNVSGNWLQPVAPIGTADDVAKVQAFKKHSIKSWVAAAASSASGDTGSQDPPLNDEQKAFVAACLPYKDAKGRWVFRSNLFLTGYAGTGKSVVLRAIVKALVAMGIDVRVTASSGFAAHNLGCGATTFHSWSGYVEKESEREERMHRKKENYTKTMVLIIDECSMLCAEMFDYVSRWAEYQRHNHGSAFGGIQLIICGDWLQLPPVDEKPQKFIFETDAWKKAKFQYVKLETIHRQTDARFIQLLERARTNSMTEADVDLLKTRITNSIPPGCVALRPFNAAVQKLNEAAFADLTSRQIYRYRAIDNGSAKRLSKEERISEELVLRKGARVMLLSNLNTDSGLVNGACGTVVGFIAVDEVRHWNAAESASALRMMAEKGIPAVCPIVTFDALGNTPARTVLIEPRTFDLEPPKKQKQKKKKADNDGTAADEERNQATRTQLPMMLAWALTIHKAQGMSVPLLNLCINDTFEYGQAYVGLSRARSLETLTLTSNSLNRESVKKLKVHPAAVKFYKETEFIRASEIRESPPPVPEEEEEGEDGLRDEEHFSQRAADEESHMFVSYCQHCEESGTASAPGWHCSSCLDLYQKRVLAWEDGSVCFTCSKQDAITNCGSCGHRMCKGCHAPPLTGQAAQCLQCRACSIRN